jgi:hypothetical protein
MKIGEYEVKILDNDTAEIGCVKVSQYEVLGVLDRMNAWVPPPPSPKFKVGDFVKVVKAESAGESEFVGHHGKIVTIIGQEDNVPYGVEFPERLKLAGSLGGITANNHGRWFNASSLELVK